MSTPFLFHHPVEVRFRDIDVGGHAHHSAAFVYFEEARAAYWRQITGRGGLDDIDYILAEAEVRWHRRVLWPQTLSVGVRVSRLGRSDFDMEYQVSAADGTRLQSGRTLQVMYDYEAGAPKRLPDDVRAAIVSFEGTVREGRRGRGGDASL